MIIAISIAIVLAALAIYCWPDGLDEKIRAELKSFYK